MEGAWWAHGECAHCLFVGDLHFHNTEDGKDQVGVCPDCGCGTLLSLMPEFPGEEKKTGAKP